MSVKRRPVVSDDYLRVSGVQKRFGEQVDITAVKRVFDAGLLKDYKSLKTTAQYIMFSGYNVAGDLGAGLYMRTDSTEQEDIGVILNIRGIRYRRIYTGSVYLEWFGTDFASTLAAASKYKYIRLASDKTYSLDRQLILKLANDLVIDMNGSRIHSTVVSNGALTIEFVTKGIQLSITKGYISAAAAQLFSFRYLSNAKFIDCNTMVKYEPATLAPVTDYILATNAYTPRPIDSLKDFTQPIECTSQAFNDKSFITNGYIQNKNSGGNIVRINKDAELAGAEYQVAPVVPNEPDNELAVVNEAYLTPVVEAIFEDLIKVADYNVIDMPLGSIYMQVASNGNFEKADEPESLFAGTYWIEYKYLNKETMPLGVSTTSKIANISSSTGTMTIAGLKVKLWQRVDAKLTQDEINSFVVNPSSIAGEAGDVFDISVTTPLGLSFTYTLEGTSAVDIVDHRVTLREPGSHIVRVIIAVKKGSAIEYITRAIAVNCKLSDIVLDTANFSNGEISYTNRFGIPLLFTIEFPANLHTKMSPSLYPFRSSSSVTRAYGGYARAIFYTKTSSNSTPAEIIVNSLDVYSATVSTGSFRTDITASNLQSKIATLANHKLVVGATGGWTVASSTNNRAVTTAANTITGEYTLLPGETITIGAKSIKVTNAYDASQVTNYGYITGYTLNDSGTQTGIASGNKIILHPKLKVNILLAPDLFVDGEATWTNDTGGPVSFKLKIPGNLYNKLTPARLYTEQIGSLTNTIRRIWILVPYIKIGSGQKLDIVVDKLSKYEASGNNSNVLLAQYLATTGALMQEYTNTKLRTGAILYSNTLGGINHVYGAGDIGYSNSITLNNMETLTVGFKYAVIEQHIRPDTITPFDPFTLGPDAGTEPAKPTEAIELEFL